MHRAGRFGGAPGALLAPVWHSELRVPFLELATEPLAREEREDDSSEVDVLAFGLRPCIHDDLPIRQRIESVSRRAPAETRSSADFPRSLNYGDCRATARRNRTMRAVLVGILREDVGTKPRSDVP